MSVKEEELTREGRKNRADEMRVMDPLKNMSFGQIKLVLLGMSDKVNISKILMEYFEMTQSRKMAYD